MFVSSRADDALGMINEGLEILLHEGVEPESAAVAAHAVHEIESAGRRIAAVGCELLGSIRKRCLHTRDGHTSAKVMVRHEAALSPGEAASREKVAVMLATLDDVDAAFRAGDLGVDQVRLLARVYANRRVQFAMVGAQEWLLEMAAANTFPDFETVVRQWESLLDADGPEPAAVRKRQFSLTQNPLDLSWVLEGKVSSVAGAQMREIFGHYAEAERLVDWEKAVAEKGDDACEADFSRTAAQRRADALYQLFLDAAANSDGSAPAEFVTNIVYSAAEFEEMLGRLAGEHSRPLDVMNLRCETLNGVQLDPAEAARVSLMNDFRRVVLTSDGVTIDLGRRRTFSGGARLATQLQRRSCYWPGCWIPTLKCEIDHLKPHAGGGLTNPGNGEPLCGCHNRMKERGFTVTRDPDGGLTIVRPDGTIVGL